MYRYIKGTIEEIGFDSITIDNNDIGYSILVSSNTAAQYQVGEKAKVFTKLIVREDEMFLCGFHSEEERNMFDMLTSISKIGPKVGLSILSFATPKQLGAYILSEDIAKISKASGVGKKTAERIILELKDKIDKTQIEFEPTLLEAQPAAISIDESVDALIALGYTQAEAKEAVKKTKKPGMETEEIIRKSLTYLMKNPIK